MNRSHVIRLNPTPEQVISFRKACGVARHAYNWALARWKDERAQGKWAKMKDLKREYNRIKGEQFPWCYEITKCAPEQEFSNLGQAFDNYWRMKKEGRSPSSNIHARTERKAASPTSRARNETDSVSISRMISSLLMGILSMSPNWEMST